MESGIHKECNPLDEKTGLSQSICFCCVNVDIHTGNTSASRQCADAAN
jgi:hypothetical protein